MKTIKLKNIYFKFSEFKYNNISELKKEFDIISAKIGKHTVIGDDAVIGNHAVIGKHTVIGDDATIGNHAVIGDDAKIGYHAVIGNHATIGYGAKIGNHATIGKHAKIGYGAKIGNHATIGKHAVIGDDATIGNHAKIGCHVNLTKSIYITGSSHTLTYTGNNTLSIGCHNYTIDKWLEKFEIIGKKENYSLEQIEEYRKYILIIKQFAENENN